MDAAGSIPPACSATKRGVNSDRSALPPEPGPIAPFLPRPQERGEDPEGKRSVHQRAAYDRAEKPSPAADFQELAVISQEVPRVFDASGQGIAAERHDGAHEEREMDRGQSNEYITDFTPLERSLR